MVERARKDDRASPEHEPARVRRSKPPAIGGSLLDLQRKAGNQAVCRMLEGSGLIRRTGGPEAAPAPPAAAPTAAPSALPTAAPPVADAPAGPALTEGDRRAIANPAAYLAEVGGTWDGARAAYKSGQIGWVSGGDDGKGTLTPTGLGMNALIAFRLQSTVLKKEDVPASNSPIEQVWPLVKEKQAEERAEKQKQLKAAGVDKDLPPPSPLKWNYGAGSGTATSDIDVNLSGDATETAVIAFNDLFRKVWGKESGTVFDVNVYARDYLPESGSKSLIDAGKAAADAGPGAVPASDTAAWAERGVSFETSMTEGSAVAKSASESQEVFSLLKTRKDMKNVDWQRFKLEQLATLGSDPEARAAKQAAFDQAELKHKAREDEIAAKIVDLDEKAAKLQAEAKPAVPPPPTEEPEAAKRLNAENALYEQNLKKVASVRIKLAVTKELFLAGQKTAEDVEAVSVELREALHGAAMYANEAYITGATVLHVVGNLQLLKGSEQLSIGLSGADYLASANEQVGFIFDDLHREEGKVWAGLLKAGKYISRLGHAAMKAESAAMKGGKPPPALASPSAAQVEKYGKDLMTIKEKVAPAKQKEALEAAQADGWTLYKGDKTNVNWVKTEILKFQSKVQTLAGKV